MNPLVAALGAAVLVLPAMASALDCTSNTSAAKSIAAGNYRLILVTDPEKITVGEHFKVDLMLCHESGAPFPATLRVDADMPAHGHGMNYRPEIAHIAPGRIRAEGLMFHMPGEWRFLVHIDEGDRIHTIEVPANVH